EGVTLIDDLAEGCLVTGQPSVLSDLEQALTDRGIIHARFLQCPLLHTERMSRVVAELDEVLVPIPVLRAPKLPWASASRAAVFDQELPELDPRAELVLPSRLRVAIGALKAREDFHFLEMGPTSSQLPPNLKTIPSLQGENSEAELRGAMM